MSIKILVTGANGQLGKTLQDLYQKNSDPLRFIFATKSELDISKKEDVFDYFSKHNYDYCINCAAYTNVERAEESKEDAYLINVDAVGYLAECCDQYNTILVHISTDYVFDGKKSSPYVETDIPRPINEYGRSKLAGEKKIQNTLKNYFIIRTSWLYSKYPKNFVTTIISKILQQTDLQITTAQKGTPTSCVELSKFIYWLIKSKNEDYGIYHFSAKGETTWYGFALGIANHFSNYDERKIVQTDAFKSKAVRPVYSVLDNSKVQQVYPHQNFWYEDVDSVIHSIK